MFDFFWVGFPMLIIGFLYLYFFAYRLLPDRTTALDDFSENDRKYVVEAEVRKNSKLVGLTIQQAELSNSKGLFLVDITRNSQTFQVIDSVFVLQEGDLLRFAGDHTNIVELLSDHSGLTLPAVA